MADRHVVDALARAAKKLGYNFAEGITHSKDAFYAEIEPDNMPNSDYVKSRWQAWERSNVMCSEMEAAAIFIVSSIRNCRASAVMAYKKVNLQAAMETAIEGLRILIEEDKKLGR